MIFIKRLVRPNKRSGHELKPLDETCVRGLIIVNKNKFSVYIDKQTPKRKRKKN